MAGSECMCEGGGMVKGGSGRNGRRRGGPPSCGREAAVPAQPEREGRGSSVGRREIPSAGADCDLSICETKSPPSFCLCSSTFEL